MQIKNKKESFTSFKVLADLFKHFGLKYKICRNSTILNKTGYYVKCCFRLIPKIRFKKSSVNSFIHFCNIFKLLPFVLSLIQRTHLLYSWWSLLARVHQFFQNVAKAFFKRSFLHLYAVLLKIAADSFEYLCKIERCCI